MRARLSLALALGSSLLAGFSGAALAQRALRAEDAPAPVPSGPDDSAPPSSDSDTSAPPPSSGSSAPASRHVAPTPAGPVRLPDGGIYVKPKFKDDLTSDDMKRETGAPAPLDCTGSPCEGLLRKRLAGREYVVHLRPAQAKIGEVAEVVVEVAELLDPPNPEMGEKKPLDGLTLQAHLEGLGRYQLHALEGSSGSYGFHFTPQAKGVRRLTVEPAAGGTGPTVDFNLPIGQPAAKGSPYELHPYEPRPGLEPTARTMADLGSAWGGLWAIAQGTGHGDAAALAKAVQRLAKAGVKEVPASAAERSGIYGELARTFAESTDRLSGAKGPALKEALSFMEQQQCERCHAAYAWGLTTDVSSWPHFKVVGAAAQGEGE